ncbi:MAG TPA: phosphoheptose isomerase [Saprospiraceae bacterium]|nr:phosphoheptose isomerase [Saprospiraceae bacterium]HNT19020.1 phosphoheptose isomerase [Saprospiraceae bacterium]
MDDNQAPGLKKIYDEKGNALSPILPEGVKNFLIDIDGTICDDVPNEEPERMRHVAPYPDALEIINKWYDQGHIIYYFTSRTEEHRQITEEWLRKHGFKYHGMLMGKPRGGNYHWIDNHIVRATRFKGKFTELIIETKEIEVFKD